MIENSIYLCVCESSRRRLRFYEVLNCNCSLSYYVSDKCFDTYL